MKSSEFRATSCCPFFKAIEDSGILPHYTLSHGPGVGFAADGAARYHRGLGVVTFGAGAFNLARATRHRGGALFGAHGVREREVRHFWSCENIAVTGSSILELTARDSGR